jgi:hypothetical protein
VQCHAINCSLEGIYLKVKKAKLQYDLATDLRKYLRCTRAEETVRSAESFDPPIDVRFSMINYCMQGQSECKYITTLELR